MSTLQQGAKVQHQPFGMPFLWTSSQQLTTTSFGSCFEALLLFTLDLLMLATLTDTEHRQNTRKKNYSNKYIPSFLST